MDIGFVYTGEKRFENIGRETVNDNKLYIKFGCNEVTKS